MIRFVTAVSKRLFFFVPPHVVSMFCFEIFSALLRLFSRPLAVDPARKNFINLGSGPYVVKGMINIDFYSTAGIDYGADLRYPLNIASDSIDGIFCEHTLEHLTYAEVGNLLKECHRIMKPGAVLRVVLPDLALFIESYSSGNSAWFAEWERLMFIDSADSDRAKRRLATPLQAISFVTQEYGHQSSWDVPTLKVYLEKAGFGEVFQTGFRTGRCSELLIDLDEADRKFVSLYVETVK